MIDPICGMKVEPSKAAGNQVYDGQTYFFCSHHCLAKFKEDPEKFLNSPANGHAAHGHEHGPEHVAPQAVQTERTKNITYVCPMDPEVRKTQPGPCPKCGMALEPAALSAPSIKTEYVCPMHPEIVRSAPGFCPICGMALEPRTVTLADEVNPELVDMTRRCWVSALLSAPVLLLAMSDLVPGAPVQRLPSGRAIVWIELILATPAVLWGGWPLFQRGWASLVNRSLNMFTLIALGVGAAYVYSVVAALVPEL